MFEAILWIREVIWILWYLYTPLFLRLRTVSLHRCSCLWDGLWRLFRERLGPSYLRESVDQKVLVAQVTHFVPLLEFGIGQRHHVEVDLFDLLLWVDGTLGPSEGSFEDTVHLIFIVTERTWVHLAPLEKGELVDLSASLHVCPETSSTDGLRHPMEFHCESLGSLVERSPLGRTRSGRRHYLEDNFLPVIEEYF